ncbi:hypothetical protein Rsub_11565 [Raphidocelis subcapitata]|uniref:Long-chain-fatty-acid--CoA ligase n=1 Tax=Raphidocelis subcapitata TaxID=307507 RepID=A0A2V0PHC0_9CHLO|nr:hypothetical protein Rsub_11565 [Raphidocelis subcapitata]|eukprot:GBF98979.1 hypothetical protein Rsub_11565 [Raphidocelis subcapitata]
MDHPPPFPVYAVALPERLDGSGSWDVYRAACSPRRLVSRFPAPGDGVATLHDNFEWAAARHPQIGALGTRERDAAGRLGQYSWITYGEAAALRTAVGSGLLRLGAAPGCRVGIYSVNCAEWVLLDAAAHAYSMVSVPLYDTLGPDAVEIIINHAELAVVGCSAAVLPTLAACLPRCPTVKLLMVWGCPGGQPPPAAPPGAAARVVTFDQVAALGRAHPRPHAPPRPSDLAAIYYTSGTTGAPKGAMLSHANLVANAAGKVAIAGEWPKGDRHISYLPLAHIYERNNLTVSVHLGGSFGFYSGNVLELMDDVQALRPHVFVSVPRLWNRIYDRVTAGVAAGGPVARALFWRAYASKKAALEAGDPTGGRWAPLWDALVFSKVRAKLGGEVKLMTSGASPLSPEVLQFLRVVFGATVIEGYGMTEASCTITIMRDDDSSIGHVGAPLPSCEVKLADVPEMGYTRADSPHPRGEVCVRGPIVFQGYYKDDAQTREVIDADGWLHTGDIGAWLPGGRLRIIDRKKNIFKLAQGEYVAPEKIENVYARSPFLLQSFVYGDPLRPQLVAVVVPDPEHLLPWARDRGLKGDVAALCREPAVAAAVQKSMDEQARAASLRGFERARAVALAAEPFTIENGLLTPTFKLKRPQARDAYRVLIDDLYRRLPDGGGGGGGGGGSGGGGGGGGGGGSGGTAVAGPSPVSAPRGRL